jgi:exonuclease SbcC
MILNRFFKPKWQHADPQVRKQALQELSSADPILVQVARQDRSPEVRRTALERLTELPLLQQIARQDTDAEVRQAAEARCRELLAGTASGSPPLAIRLTALPELPADLVEFLALHGKEPELRLAALEQVEEEPLLERIVTDDPAANVRLAALERILTAPTLERIVKQSRSRDKGVYRRAQDRLDTSRAEQRRASRIQQLYVELEQLHWDGETGPQAARFPRLEKEWQELAAAADPGLRERYARARAQFLAERQTSVARRTARLEICANLERFLGTLQHEHELTPGLELALQETLQTTQSEWDHCGTVEDIEERRLEQRFLEVTRLLKEQERSLRRNHERALRLRTVLQQANALLNQPSEVLETDLKTLQQQWTGLERPETRELATQLQTEFDILLNKLRARLQRQVEHRDREWQELQELINALEKALEEGELQRAIELNNLARQRLQENIGLSRKQMTAVEERLHACTPHLNELRGWRRWGTNQAREHLCEQAESLSGLAADPPELARQIKELRTTWKTLDSVEGAASRALWKRFDGACERAYKPCQVYFEAQNHERQRHLAKKLALCERLERLLADTHWEQADWQWVDRSWREIQKEWHKVGPVNRADQKSLEHRFNAALQHVDKQLRVERERELQRRQALIERVQQLAASTDLQAAVEGAKQAQAEWHPTVQSGRREEQTLWRQFRAACDAVFTRRQAMQQAADVERQTNLARKTALCEEIEALATVDGEAIRQARKRFQEIQAEWPDIGPVPKTAVKAIEQRFLAAGDQLQRHSQALRQAGIRQELWSLRERARLCSRLEALLATAVPAEVETRLAEARQAWEQLPALQTTLAEPMQRRFETVCQALTTGDEARQALWRALEANLHKKQILCLRLEIAAGVESPLEFAQARMEYQVARLSESLSNRETAKSEDVREEVRKIQEAWCLLGVLPAAQQELLEQRFERALTALA